MSDYAIDQQNIANEQLDQDYQESEVLGNMDDEEIGTAITGMIQAEDQDKIKEVDPYVSQR